MTASLTRSQRAMQIERRTFRQWTANVVGISVPSQTVAGKKYIVTPTGCDCADSRYRVGTPNGPRMCKHVAALHLAMGRNAA
jgi:predicted nucleic acid-binding Zn finger protein